MRTTKNTGILLILGLLGLLLAGLSGLSDQVPFLASWCAWFSGGCRQTVGFTLFSIQVWVWGAAFYALLCLIVLVDRVLLDWLIPVAIGVEAALVGIMIFLEAPCVFCMANAVVVVLLGMFGLRWEMRWKSLALILAGFMAFGTPLVAQNGLLAKYCGNVQPAPAVAPQSTDATRPPEAPAVSPVPIVPPVPRSVDVPVGNSQSTGPLDAPVTVTVFSDFRCPACRRMNVVVAQAMKDYGSKVRWVFKNFPLQMHPDAAIAAEGALCAAAQNKFWEYHDVLFTTEETFTPDSLTGIAGNLGLDQTAFRNCLDTHASQTQVEEEIAQGVAAKVAAVPTVIINGQMKTGVLPAQDFKAAIDAALAKAATQQ